MDYVVAPKCNIARQATMGKILEAGQMYTCPDCGRTWLSTIKTSFGGKPIADWVCTSTAGAAGLPDRVAALQTLTAAQGDLIAAAQAQITAQAKLISALTASLAATNARFPYVKTQHTARADGLAVALGGTLDVTFTWPTPFTDAAYTFEAPLPPSLLGKVTVTTKSQTAAAVVLTLKANTLAVTAFTWFATAWKVS